MSLTVVRDPTVEHLGAIDRADAALKLAVEELSVAWQAYLRDPDADY